MMEQELFFSGYCRMTDSSRTVTAVTENQVLTEIDCNYENCIYSASCPIGKQVTEAIR